MLSRTWLGRVTTLVCLFLAHASFASEVNLGPALCDPLYTSPTPQDFNQWMRYISKELGVSQSTYKSYLKSIPKEVLREGEKLGLSEIETVTLATYTGSLYSPVNKTLISGSPEQKQALAPLIRTLQGALQKLPDYHGKVRRMTALDLMKTDGPIAAHVPGAIVEYPIFISTTKGTEGDIGRLTNPWDWDNVLEIEVHGGAKDISWLNPVEGEVLFPPGARFRVIEVTPRNTGHANKFLYRLEEIPQPRGP